MAIVDDEDFIGYLRGANITDVYDLVPGCLEAAHQSFYNLCGRSFEVAGDTATARTYRPTGEQVLRIHDCTTVTAVTTNGTAVTTYLTEPNGPTWAGETRPIEQLRLWGGWWQYSTEGAYSISVTAKWGWAAAPAAAKEAIKVLGKDILSNRDIRFGIVNIEDVLAVARRNPFVLSVANQYSRLEVIGIAG